MRVHNWDVSLVMFAREVNGSEFEWGKTDCASLVRRSATIINGEDPFKIKMWSTQRGARRVLKTIEVPQVLIDAGGYRVTPWYEQTGDIAVSPGLDRSGLPRFSVILPDSRALISTPESGVVIVPNWRTALVKGTEVYRIG